MSFLVFDVESIAIPNAADYLEPAVPPSNYVKQEAIDAYLVKANHEQLQKAALDVDLARIVAIGISTNEIPSMVLTASNEKAERDALESFWGFVNMPSKPTLIGFACLNFDLPLLLRRSLYLGVKTPKVQVGKYRHDGVRDLMMELSFDGALRYRGLKFYAKRLGLEMPPDPYTGADIASLIADNNWDAVADHCRADVNLTVALAKRMGVIE